MVPTLLVTGQTNQKSFKGIFKSVKIRTSQLRNVTKGRIALHGDSKSGVSAAYIRNYEFHNKHPQHLHTGKDDKYASVSPQISILGSQLYLKKLYGCYQVNDSKHQELLRNIT